MATPEQFTYTTVWSEADQEWVGLCNGFDPAMNWMAPDQQAALDGIHAIVGEFLELLDERGLPHPEPPEPSQVEDGAESPAASPATTADLAP